ncbi:MAG: WD40 repeat domain-containing protein [Caldilineaceae bacterium]
MYELLQHTTVFPLVEHGRNVTTLAFSPDGLWLATGSDDSIIRLWRFHNLDSPPLLLSGHGGVINSLAFSLPDGRWLATGSDDKTVRLWDMYNLDTAPVVLSGHRKAVNALAFSPDGKWLASGSDDSMVRLWKMNDLDATPVMLRGDGYRVLTLAFSPPDGQWLAIGSDDWTLRLWRIYPLEESPLLIDAGNSVNTVAFSPNGKLLAAASETNWAQRKIMKSSCGKQIVWRKGPKNFRSTIRRLRQ